MIEVERRADARVGAGPVFGPRACMRAVSQRGFVRHACSIAASGACFALAASGCDSACA
jgi:hypothetical protein